MAFKIWGLGSLTSGDNFDGITEYTNIEATEGDDINNHITKQRVERNLFENELETYRFLEKLAESVNEKSGVFKGSLENAFSFSDTNDVVSLKVSSTYEQTQVQTIADSSGSLSGTYFNLYSTTSDYYMWFNIDGSSFNPGLSYPEITEVVINTDASGLDGDYFLLSSSSTDYYVWMNVDNGSTDPAIGGRTGIEVNILSTDTEAEVAGKIATVLQSESAFSISTTTQTITITNNTPGSTINAADSGANNFSITITQQGQDAAASGAGIEVGITTDDTAEIIAGNIDTALESIPAFNGSYSSGDTLIIINEVAGEATNATDVDTGFTITTVNDGVDAYKHYVRIAPGIAYHNDTIIVNKPQTHIAERQLEKIFGLTTWTPNPEHVTVNYDFTTDLFTAEIVKRNDQGSLITHTFNNGGSGYPVFASMLEDIYNNNIFHTTLYNNIGTDFTKILCEPILEITTSNSYFLGIDDNGNFQVNIVNNELDLYSFNATISGDVLSVASVVDLRPFFQNFNDFKQNVFLNVGTEDQTTEVITSPTDDTNYDYLKVVNATTLLTILHQDTYGENDNVVFGWVEGALPGDDSSFSNKFFLNKDIVIRYGNNVGDSASFSDVVESIDSLGTASLVDTGTGEGQIPTTDFTTVALEDTIVRTVGAGGDHATINEALEYLTRKYYGIYLSGREVSAVVQLLDGFVMEEQVLINQRDLSWIRIESLVESGDTDLIEGISEGTQIPDYEQPEISQIEVSDYLFKVEGDYFKLITVSDEEHYWYYNTISGLYDPAVEDGVTGTGHEIIVDESDTQVDVAGKVQSSVDGVSGFTAVLGTNNNVEITYDVSGTADVVFEEGRIFDGSIVTLGDDVTSTNQVVDIYIIEYTYADITEKFDSTVLNGNYIELQDHILNNFYFWFNVNGGATDPTISGSTGYEVTILDSDDASTVASKLQLVINTRANITATVSGRIITATNDVYGDVNHVSSTGSYVNTLTIKDGRDLGYQARLYLPGHQFSTEQRIIIKDHVGEVEEVNYNGIWFLTAVTNDYVELNYTSNHNAVYTNLRAGTGIIGQVIIPGEVTVSREALTTNWEYFYYPAFGVARGKLPLIATTFSMDDSGVDPGYGSYRDGLCATDQGVINILPYSGFKNAHGSNIYGTRNSLINSNDAIADGAGRHGVWAYSSTLINCRRVSAINCGLGGSLEDTGEGFDSLDRPVGNGILATRGSTINADGCTVTGSQGDNILAEFGSLVNVGSHGSNEFISSGSINGQSLNTRGNSQITGTIKDIQIPVTVGSGGDYDTINEALKEISRNKPLYDSSGITATINLLAGFVMAEQVLVYGLDLGWITIVGEDAETVITHTALTIDFAGTDYENSSYPAFGVSKGGTLPRVGQLFEMSSGAIVDGYKNGVEAIGAGSSADVLNGCGVKNAGRHGMLASESATINADGANVINAGGNGVIAYANSTINAAGVDASGAEGSSGCIVALDGSTINANLANASGSWGNGIFADRSSTINARGADASGAGTYGIYAYKGSMINAEGADASGAGSICIHALRGSTINAERANASGAGSYGIFAYHGSTINANGATGTLGQTANTLTSYGIIFRLE